MDSTVELEIEVVGQHVIARLLVKNTSADKPLYLEKIKGFTASPLRAKLFRVTSGGVEVPYIGALAKTEAPKRGDFLTVAPGGQVKGAADITSLYAFGQGPHTYEIVYSTFHADPDDPGKLTVLKSNQATFVFQR